MFADAPAISGIGLLSLGLLTLALYTTRLAWFASASRSWPSTPGRMLYSGVDRGRGDFPTRSYVHYSYVVDGKTYESRRLRFGLFPSGDPMSISELHALQGKGRLRVYYDPKKPSRSCLLTGINPLTFTVPFLLMILSMLFMAADLFVSNTS